MPFKDKNRARDYHREYYHAIRKPRDEERELDELMNQDTYESPLVQPTYIEPPRIQPMYVEPPRIQSNPFGYPRIQSNPFGTSIRSLDTIPNGTPNRLVFM
jgi:hypothetical protein